MRTGLAVLRLGSWREALASSTNALTKARISDAQWDFPALRERCADALAREPATADDWHLRLYGSKAISFLSADPTPAMATIDAARKSGDAGVVAATLVHETQLLAAQAMWLVALPYEPTWVRMRELTERAAAAYEALGDADTALELMARLAVHGTHTEDGQRLLAWCEAKAAELTEPLARAYCLTAAACIRIDLDTAAKEAARKALAANAEAGARLLAAEVQMAIAGHWDRGDPSYSYLQDAAVPFAASDHWRGMYDVQYALGHAYGAAEGNVSALLAFEVAARAADRTGIPHMVVRAHLRHAQMLFRLGQTGDALAEIEEVSARIPAGGRYRLMLLLQLGQYAAEVNDIDRGVRSFSEAVRIVRELGGPPRDLAFALSGVGKAHADRSDLGGLLVALRAFKRAAAVEPSVSAFEDVATTCGRLARRYALKQRRRPAWLRKRADAALRRGYALARTEQEHLDLHVAASLVDYHFDERDAALERIDEAVTLATMMPLPARIGVCFQSVMQRIDYGMMRGDAAMLDRAGADAEEALGAIRHVGRHDLERGALHDSAWANAALACIAPTPEARMSALAKARHRIAESIELYERANDRLRAGTAAKALAPQLGYHGVAAIPYELGVRIFHMHGDSILAFEALERLKATVLASALASIRVPPPAGVPPELVQEEQRLLAISGSDHDPRARASAGVALEKLWREIASMPGGDRYARLRRGDTIAWPEASLLWANIQREVGPDRRFVIVEYAVLRDSLLDGRSVFAFVMHGGETGPEIVPLKIAAREIEEAAEALQPEGIHGAEAPEILASLGALLEPVRSLTRPGDVLCVIPSRGLFSIPIHAVPIDGEPLLARNPVFYATSVTTLAAALQLRRAHESRTTVLGNPTNDLDGAEEEAKTIAAMLHAPLHLREEATAAAFLDALRTQDIVHYAGHAGFDPRQPMLSGLKLADGILTAEKLFAAGDAAATLVVLSGCETGLNRVASGDEIVGLTRAFLYAGVPTLLTSLWEVYDETTMQLMTRFYDCWLNRSMTRLDALRTAALEVRASHPDAIAAWAAFVLVGDWR